MNQKSVVRMPSAMPVEVHINPVNLQKALERLPKLFPRLYCCLIARHGHIAAEQYYNGGEPGRLNDLRSATKSFLSALIGIAVHRGDMPLPEEPILPYLEADMPVRSITNEGWRNLTFKHLLTMTSGLHWQTGNKLGERWIHRFHNSSSWLRFALRLPVHPERHGKFQYRSIDSHLLSVLLTRCTGMRADEYAEHYLFRPLGISEYRWDLSPDGHAAGHIGLHLTGRDMLAFGQLILNDGKRLADSRNEGAPSSTAVIPVEWIRESLQPHVAGLPAFGHYGYQWWVHRLGSHDAACAVGHGGQLIYVIPSHGLTVVFAGNPRVCRWRHPKRWIEEWLLPSCS